MNVKNKNKTNKIKTSRLMLWLGIVFGLTLTAFLWLGDSEQTYTSLRWTSYVGITSLGVYLLIRVSRRRAFTLLALCASVSIIYLFPALLGPGCDGMPRAFAAQCGIRWDCGDNECCHGGECLSKSDPRCGGSPTVKPPVISSTISCTLGSSGWCVGNAQLSLNASDPQGYAVTISGNMGNVPISCNGSCTFNLPEGSGTATYTATAATSKKTASGSKAWWYDPEPPESDVNVGGTSGSNGWYISAVNASASGSDSISGLASATLSADGGVAAGSVLLTDGVHSITTTARDVAGNSSSKTMAISVDTVSPIIHTSAAGNQAEDGWFSTAVDLSATAEDATSGVAGSVSMSFDNGATWVSDARTLYDGRYDVMFRVSDHAGNISTSQTSLKIDMQPPSISLSETGRLGQNGWYVSSTNVSAEVSDNLSGVTSTQVRVDGGAWQAGTFVTVEEGIHTIDFQSFDSAGNIQSVSREIRVDLTPPAYTFDRTLNGSVLANTVNLDGTVSDKTSTVQNVEFSSDGRTWHTASFAEGHWNFAWNSSVLGNGDHNLFLHATDMAGNKGEAIDTRIILDNDPPYVKLTETWNVWESGSLVVFNNVIPLKNVKTIVHDPMLRYADRVIYDEPSAPDVVTWDRVLGPASAPPGSYTVTVEVCDIYSLCSKGIGTIVIPVVPTLVPLIQSPVTEIPQQWIPPIPLPPEPVPEQPIVVPVVVVPMQEEAQIVPSFPVWTIVDIGAFLLCFALLLLTDSRPSAWRSLTRSLHHHIQDFKE